MITKNESTSIDVDIDKATVIEAVGFCTPLGDTPEQVLSALYNGDQSGMKQKTDLLFDQLVTVGEVTIPLAALAKEFSGVECRNNRLLQHCAKRITPPVEQLKKQYSTDRIAVVLGSSTAGIAEGEVALANLREHGEFPDEYDYQQQELGNCSRFIADYFGLTGLNYSVSTACSSSAKVFATGKRLLESGLCDAVIVGGSDSLCQLTVNGFNALESISDGLCNPFSAHRDGINIGEGAALFVLTQRPTKIDDIIVAGVGETSDAHHISAPHPEGVGAIASMSQALSQAKLSYQDIDYLNLHGTATVLNDAMESRAVNQVFSDNMPFCSSTKPLTGHTLGAAGAIEASFGYLLLNRTGSGSLPKHVWDGVSDPTLVSLPLTNGDESVHVKHVMSNSFAFGGSNCTLILSKITH